MSARLVASLVAVSLLVSACGPLVICSTDAPCAQASSSHDEDHSTAIVLGTTLAVFLFAALAMTKASSSDEPKKAPAPIAPRAADPSTMVFAPMPPVTEEGEQLRLQRMYVQGEVLAHAGRCDGALSLGRQIARSSPGYYQVYAAEPVIAACVAATSHRL